MLNWRQIARANRIEDLRALQNGDEILLPPLDDFETRERFVGRRNA